MFDRIAGLPLPSDPALLTAVYAALQEEHCTEAKTLVVYEVALHGLPARLTATETAFAEHLAGTRSQTSCAAMAELLTATAAAIPDKTHRRTWLRERFETTRGKENYFDAKPRVQTDESITRLAKLAGQKMPAEAERIAPLLDAVTAALRAAVAGEREPRACRVLAAKITAAGKAIRAEDIKGDWADELARIIAGKEAYRPKSAKKGASDQRDPCADAIAALKAN